MEIINTLESMSKIFFIAGIVFTIITTSVWIYFGYSNVILPMYLICGYLFVAYSKGRNFKKEMK